MSYPRPDRSRYVPHFAKSAEDDTVDIGWTEGTMSDGRPFRAECWAQGQSTCISIMFARAGFEGATKENVGDLLEIEGILRFKDERRPLDVRPFTDDGGNALLMVNVVVADDDEIYAEDRLSFQNWKA